MKEIKKTHTHVKPLNRKNIKSNGFTDKIEIVKCPRGNKECNSQVSILNKMFYESNNYQHNKEYQLSVRTLKNAFKKTYELQDTSCKKCARFFRSTIIDSLENIHSELQHMSGGFYRKNHYKGSYLLVQNTLKDLKKQN